MTTRQNHDDPSTGSGSRGEPDEPIHIDARDARGAEIILKKRRNRMIFIAGLVGFVVLMIVVRLFG